ncbi:MAG: type pilus modification protein PilV [Pseudomonadota bacterium]|jgi:type IV pilus assembly protein PilV
MPLKTRHFDQQAGSTLIEVLVSLLILAFGLLSMGGLQTVSLRNNQAAYYRTQATMFANDMADRMRANMVAVTAGDYDDVAGADTANCFTAAGCTPAQMAAQDIDDWEDEVATALPGGASVVCLDATQEDGTPLANACSGTGTVYAIKIWWDDDRDGTAEQRYVLSFQPES